MTTGGLELLEHALRSLREKDLMSEIILGYMAREDKGLVLGSREGNIVHANYRTMEMMGEN